MKKILHLLSVTVLAWLAFGTSAMAQCPNDNTLFFSYSAPTTIGASVGSEVCIYAGEYYMLNNMVAGNTYRISSCGSPDIVDTRITVYPSAGGSAAAFNDDFCGTLAQLDFTPTTSGNYRVLLDQTGPGNTCTSTTGTFECGEIVVTLIGTSGGGAYCVPQYAVNGGTNNGDYINAVSLGSINNANSGSSNGPSFTDYSALSTSLSPNTQYTLSVQNNPDFTENVAAWIDYNGDLTYSESEKLGQTVVGAGATATITFTTPSSVVAGTTRMRVRMAFTIPVSGGQMDPCALYQFGETEDYRVVFPSDPPGPPGDNSYSTACGLNTSIQDNACPNATFASVTVSGLPGALGATHRIQSVDVIIEHAMAADLDMYLEAPNGSLVELSTDNGQTGADYGVYEVDNCTQYARFSMTASTPISGGAAPFIGAFLPEGDLNDFNNNAVNPNGIWRLRVCDDFAGDAGTIRYFRVNFEVVQNDPPACAEAYALADAAQNVSLDQQISWTPGIGVPTSFDVYFGTDANPALASDDQSGTTYNPGTLLPNTTYYYQIVPANAAGSATGCPVRSFTTTDNGDVILMANGSINTCTGTFADPGGVNGDYFTSDTLLFTIYPDQANSAVQAVFNSFELENGFDFLVILDGVDENANVIGFYQGTDSPGTVVATNTAGALTFAFVSDEILTAPGWTATLSCVPNTAVPQCASALSPGDAEQNVLLDADLSWTAPQGEVTGYDVYFGTSATPELVASAQAGTSYSLPTLAYNTTYYYQVVPVNGNGAATGCPVLSFTTQNETQEVILMQNGTINACSAVFYDSGGEGADYANGESLTLYVLPDSPNNLVSVTFNSFSTDPGFDVLNVYNGTNTNVAPIAALGGSALSTPFTITSDSPDGALTFVFNSDFQVTSSGWSGIFACVPNTTAPACAADLAPANQATGISLNTELSWTSGGGAPTSYDVYFGTDAQNLELVAGNYLQTTYAVGPLTGGTTYFWQVVPENTNGSATDCEVFSFTTTTENQVLMTTDTIAACGSVFYDSGGPDNAYAPNEFSFLTFVPENAGDFVQVDFTSFNTEAGFDILFVVNGSNPTDETQFLGFFSGSDLPPSFTSTATDGALTFVFISDEFDTGASGWSANISCVTPPQIPSCVTAISPASGDTGVAVTASLSWNAATGQPDSYNVYFGTDAGALALVGTTTETSYNPVGLLPSTTYFWQIVPENELGTPTDCPVFSYTTAAEVVILPGCATTYTPASGAVDQATDLSLSWSGATGNITGYEVYFGTDALNLTMVANGPETSYNAAGLTEGTTYFWQVVPVDGSLAAEGCAVNSFTTLTTVVPEDIIMQNGSVTACSGNFYDEGGLDGDYSTDLLDTLVITPSTPGSVLQVVFSAFATEEGYDSLMVFNGNSVNAPLIGSYTGTNSPGTVVSTAADGSLTFVFSSDFIFTDLGWEAVVSCIDPNAAPSCASNLSPAEGSTDVSVNTDLSWSNGGGVVTGYDVFFGTSPSALTQLASNTTSTSISAGQLELNTTYYYQVVALNGNSSASDCPVVSFTTQATPVIEITTDSITICDAVFVDNGGLTGDYLSDSDETLTIFPATAGNVVQVIFNTLDVEEDFDFVTIYDGSSTAAPVLATLTGVNDGASFISSAIDGALTIQLTSDGSVENAGWNANIVCVDTTAVPACAANLAPADASTGVLNLGVVLSWTAPTGVVSGYDVYFGTDAQNLVLVSDDQTATSYDAGDLDLNTTYYWQVIPFNNNGAAESCAVVSFTTTNSQVVNQQDVVVTSCDALYFDSNGPDANYNNDESSTVTFIPDQPNNAVQVTFTAFELEQSTFTGTIFDSLIVYNGPDASSPVLGIFSGTTIPGPFVSTHPSGQLTFYFSSDESVPLAGWEATVSCVSTADAPTCADSYAPADAATAVPAITTLSWVPGQGVATGYDVYFGTDPGNLVLVSEGQIETTFNPGTLETATTYYWQIVPSNSNGAAEGCPVNSFTTDDVIELVIFNGEVNLCQGNLFDTGGADGNYAINEDYTLTIYPSTPGSFVQLDFVSFDVEDGWDFLDIYDGNSTAGTLLSSNTGTALPASVVSTSADGSITLNFLSDFTVTTAGFEIAISCFTPQEAPGCATNLNPADLTVDASTSSTLSWSPGTGSATGYDVYFGTDPGSLVLVSDDQTATTYSPANLADFTTYYWQVIPSNAVGSAEGCSVQSFTTSGTEDIIIFNGADTTCNANFYDSGGANGNYLNNENYVLTLYPGAANNVLQVTFNAFGGEACCDDLFIFNGNSTAAPQLANLFGAPAMPQTFTSTAADGSLTFQFTSDVSSTGLGFSASVICVDTTVVPECAIVTGPTDGAVDQSPTNTTFTWTPGAGYVTGYNVYFGTDCDNMVLVSENQPGTSFSPGQLDLNSTYVWMVEPLNSNGPATGCSCNSFTTGGSIDIIMSNNTVTTCAANFYDSGGPDGNYLNGENYTLTISPDQPNNAIQVLFNTYNLENNFEFLTIYDGNSTAAPVIGTFSGAGPTGPITSTAVDGSLTFTFTSDGSVTRFGWDADVTCVSTTEPPACVNITAGPADGATDICINEAQVSWTMGTGSPANGYDVYFQIENTGFILLADNQTQTSFDPGVLEPNTNYSFIIVATNANGDAAGCDTISFTTGTCLNYCDAGATICDEFIANVQAGAINNASDCGLVNGYSDYTAISTDVYIGTSTPITVDNGTLDWTGDQCGIWVDWNHDGDFADANETIAVTGTPGTGPYTGNLTPPVDAVVGPTTMRVRITFTGVVDPCGTTTFGEVEDYTIIVNEALACPFPNNIAFSETSTDATIITWDNVTGSQEYLIRYRAVTEDVSVATWSTPISVIPPDNFSFFLNLQPCTDYLVQVASLCPDGTDTTFSPVTTFQTRCIVCEPEFTAELEPCGQDLNGGCNSTPASYEPIACGQTICGTSFMDGNNRDTDWFQLDVTNAGVYTVNILAEFDGTVFFADVADCNNLVIPSQGNFTATQPFTLATSLTPGTYAVILVPVFEQPVFDCNGYNAYTLELSGGETQIAPVADQCVNGEAITLFAIPSGGTWSGTGITDGAAGTFDPATAGEGSFEITYNATSNGCASSATATINVVAAPPADFVGLDATYCPSDADVTLTGIPAGGTFTIDSPNGDGLNGDVFSPGAVAAGVYGITYTVNTNGSCAATITQTVEVFAAPAVSFTLADSTCSMDAPIALSATPAGGIFSGPGVFAGTFDPMLAGVGAIDVTYSVTIDGSTCPGVAVETVQVNAAPVVTLSGLASVYCLNSTPVTLSGTPSLGSFSGPGVTGNVFDPSVAGVGTHVIRYEFDNGTCIGYSEVTVDVTDNLSVTFNAPTSICSDADPFVLQSTPAGAVFSGPGVNGGTFSPAVAGVGTHTIVATLNNGTCTATTTQTITVNPAPVASFNYSANGASVVFVNSSVNATSYSWDFGDNTTSSAANPTHVYTQNGAYEITLVASSPGCGSDTFSVQLELSVGIGAIDGVDMIQLYPNPTHGNVNLSFNSLNAQSFEVRITDEIGRLIQVDNLTNYIGKFNKNYDLSELARGVYTFTVSSEKGAINFRVVRH